MAEHLLCVFSAAARSRGGCALTRSISVPHQPIGETAPELFFDDGQHSGQLWVHLVGYVKVMRVFLFTLFTLQDNSFDIFVSIMYNTCSYKLTVAFAAIFLGIWKVLHNDYRHALVFVCFNLTDDRT